MENATQIISNLGFPIAVCLGLAYYIQTTMKELINVISNNNVVLEKLLTKIGEK